MSFQADFDGEKYHFPDLKTLLAKASPLRSADELAGVAAHSETERIAARFALADMPLKTFLDRPLLEQDEVTKLILESHVGEAFAPVAGMTVGEFRDWLLRASGAELAAVSAGLTPEMAAGVSKLMRAQDLIAVARKIRVVTKFRDTLGLDGRFSTRLQPNHPTDDVSGILATTIDGLLLGSGDAVIGVNPATDNVRATGELLRVLDEFRERFEIPTQTCVLSHVTTMLAAMEAGAPVDLIFQSIAGSEKANRSFGVDLKVLDEAFAAGRALGRGENFMYFETGQGSALSADAHFEVDAQTMEARAYAVARRYKPLLVNTVVGFIGPEYLFNGKQITRAGLEDHFCGKLLGLPMGCDVCYTNHAEADSDDMDGLLLLLASAGCTYVMGVPGADDIMLGYQSTSFHDALFVREVLGLRPSPEFEDWLVKMKLWNAEECRPLSAGAARWLEGALK